MATVLGLAMKITADASGLRDSLTPVERKLQQLGEIASSSASLFDKFLGSTTGAAAAQQQFATDVAFLTSALKTGQVTAQQFAQEFAALQQSAQSTAAAFAEGARITEANRTAEERRSAELQRLGELLKAGAFSQETYNRAVAEASGANAAAAQAEQQRAAAFAEAQKLTEQFSTSGEKQAARLQRLSELYATTGLSLDAYNRAAAEALGIDRQAANAAKERADAVAKRERMGADAFDADQARRAAEATQLAAEAAKLAAAAEQERARFTARATQLQEQARTALQRYDAEVQELVTHLNAGTLGQQEFNTLVEQATQRFIRAESAAKGYDAAVQGAGSRGNLAFNELAGTLAILPGPIGNVAGRLSGITSAAEGLNRIFSNGGGIGQFGTALAGLVNPTTLALGALAGFGTAAVAVGRNLVQLEGEVERLGQLADRLGVSFGFIQVLQTAATQTGGSVEALGGSFTKFLRSVDDARNGGRAAAQAFRDLGLGAEQVRASSPERLFTQAAQAIAKIDDPARRAAVAVALFGKSGAELLPVFRQIGQASVDLQQVGNVLTDQQRAQIDAFGASLDRLGVASSGLYNQISADFAGIGTVIAEGAAQAIGAVTRLSKSLDDAVSQRRSQIRGDFYTAWLGEGEGARRIKELDDVTAAANKLSNVETPALVTADQFDLASRLAKTLDDLKAASEDFGTNQELAGAAAQRALDTFAKEAEAAGMSADAIKSFVTSADADFKKFIQGLQQLADESDKAARQRERAVEMLLEADRRRADAFMQSNNLANEANAAEDLLAITRQIEQAEQAIGEARAKNDRAGELAAIRRLRALDQAKAAAQDNVAFGFNENDIARAVENARGAVDEILVQALDFGAQGAQAAKQFEQAFANSRRNLELKLINPDQFDEAVEGQRKLFADRIRQLEEVRGIELQLINEKASLEEKRVRDLITARQPLQLADVRTTEGQRQFLAAANRTDDPAIAEYRLGRLAIERLERKLEVARKVELK